MPPELSADSKFEIGHVFFIDIVGYSKLLIKEQSEQLANAQDRARNRAIRESLSGRQVAALAHRRWQGAGLS